MWTVKEERGAAEGTLPAGPPRSQVASFEGQKDHDGPDALG